MRKLLISLNVAVLLMTCVFNFVMSPLVLCLMDGGGCTVVTFTSVQGMYPRVVALTCFVSFSTLTYHYCTIMPAYEKNIRAQDVYSPTTAKERRNRALYPSLCAVVCLFVVLPVNVMRLWTLYRQGSSLTILVFFVFMYTENIGMYLAEMCFVTLCHTLDQKFSKINRDLERLGGEIVVNPIAIPVEDTRASAASRVMYGRDFYQPLSGEYSVANAVEILRIRHQLIRDAVYVLIDVFGVPMGMSLFCLCVMTLFDIYYQVFRVMGAESRSLLYIYMWLLQYSIRFYTIVVTAHNTTKQVISYTQGCSPKKKVEGIRTIYTIRLPHYIYIIPIGRWWYAKK